VGKVQGVEVDSDSDRGESSESDDDDDDEGNDNNDEDTGADNASAGVGSHEHGDGNLDLSRSSSINGPVLGVGDPIDGPIPRDPMQDAFAEYSELVPTSRASSGAMTITRTAGENAATRDEAAGEWAGAGVIEVPRRWSTDSQVHGVVTYGPTDHRGAAIVAGTRREGDEASAEYESSKKEPSGGANAPHAGVGPNVSALASLYALPTRDDGSRPGDSMAGSEVPSRRSSVSSAGDFMHRGSWSVAPDTAGMRFLNGVPVQEGEGITMGAKVSSPAMRRVGSMQSPPRGNTIRKSRSGVASGPRPGVAWSKRSKSVRALTESQSIRSLGQGRGGGRGLRRALGPASPSMQEADSSDSDSDNGNEGEVVKGTGDAGTGVGSVSEDASRVSTTPVVTMDKDVARSGGDAFADGSARAIGTRASPLRASIDVDS